jgi:hypothetical protein
MPKQGGYPDGNGGPAGPTGTPRECEQVDRKLAAALAGELPVTANITPEDAVPATWSCPSAPEGGAEFTVPGGRITVLLVAANQLMAMGPTESVVTAQASTSDGRNVLVISSPSEAGGAVPYESDLNRFATDIAAEY